MAIQTRRGDYGSFDPDRLVAGEWATVTSGDPHAEDGRAVYMCFVAGDVKRMATYEDMVDYVRDEVVDDAIEPVREQAERATQAANLAADAVLSAQSAQSAAEQAQRAASTSENRASSYKSSAEVAASAARTSATQAENAVNKITVATAVKTGIVRPDGTTITVNDAGTISSMITTAKKLYFAAGDSGISANDTEAAIKEVNGKLPFRFGVDSEGNCGYIPTGADTVIPFSRVKTGVVKMSTASTVTIELGFKPKYLAMCSSAMMFIYDERRSTTKVGTAGTSVYKKDESLNITTANRIASISDSGTVVINKASNSTSAVDTYYFAIG